MSNDTTRKMDLVLKYHTILISTIRSICITSGEASHFSRGDKSKKYNFKCRFDNFLLLIKFSL
jgi:hypothetical protein